MTSVASHLVVGVYGHESRANFTGTRRALSELTHYSTLRTPRPKPSPPRTVSVPGYSTRLTLYAQALHITCCTKGFAQVLCVEAALPPRRIQEKKFDYENGGRCIGRPGPTFEGSQKDRHKHSKPINYFHSQWSSGQSFLWHTRCGRIVWRAFDHSGESKS